MNKLRSLASEKSFVSRKTSKGTISIESLKIHFTRVEDSQQLPDMKDLPRTYRSKPLVTVGGEILFGELAILRYLQRDGWDGVWLDAFHSRGQNKKFWSGMPFKGQATLPLHAEQLYDKIVAKNGGKLSGFFDVFAWKDGDYVFVEYKGKGDSPNKNELNWIEAAISAGVKPEQLFIVTY